jgi:hypothetical protein
MARHRYRVSIHRELTIEVRNPYDEHEAREAAARALIEDVARRPFDLTDPVVDRVGLDDRAVDRIIGDEPV